MDKKLHTIDYFVNDEPQSTTEKELTPVQIMTNAGIDPDTNYLIEIRGDQQVSYKEKANDPIKLHEKMRFISNFTGPTQVSS